MFPVIENKKVTFVISAGLEGFWVAETHSQASFSVATETFSVAETHSQARFSVSANTFIGSYREILCS